jgi:phage baseplate assembly protein V
MDIAELSRRLENLIRIGTVAEVDHANALVRVDTGGLRTAWLPWFEHRAGNTRSWDPFTVGEQVMILSPSGEPAAGIVLAGIYQTAHGAPSASASEHVTDFPDGARVSYDHASGALAATGIKTAVIEASSSVTADTPHTHITGVLEVDGLLIYHDGITGQGGGNGNTISGDFTHTAGNLSSNGIVLHTHYHTGVQPGAGNTAGPA